MDFKDKVAVITGGAQGIGRCIAEDVGGGGGRAASAGDMGTVGREPSVCDTDGCAGQGEADEVLCS